MQLPIEVCAKEINHEKVKAAMRVLMDNGIEPDEAGTVLQAIGYALIDTELEPIIDEV